MSVSVQPSIPYKPLNSTVSKTLSANNTTASVPLWRVTGIVHVTKLYGVVTTNLGANHTAAYFRLNDQTAQEDITLNTGATLSGFAAGGFLVKDSQAGSDPLTAQSAAAGHVYDATTAGAPIFAQFTAQAKAGANTDIEYRYSTTDAPTSGVIQFFIEYYPLSADGALTAQ